MPTLPLKYKSLESSTVISTPLARYRLQVVSSEPLVLPVMFEWLPSVTVLPLCVCTAPVPAALLLPVIVPPYSFILPLFITPPAPLPLLLPVMLPPYILNVPALFTPQVFEVILPLYRLNVPPTATFTPFPGAPSAWHILASLLAALSPPQSHTVTALPSGTEITSSPSGPVILYPFKHRFTFAAGVQAALRVTFPVR